MKILMFTRVKIFDKYLRGGAKRFYELYIQLSKNHDVEMCTVDDVVDYIANGIKGTVFPNIIFNKKKPLKSSLEIYNATKIRVKEIRNRHYDKIIVFGIPSAIVLSLFNMDNIYLFLRDDLIGYRKISMGYPEKKISLKNKVYLQFLNLIEGISIKRCHRLVVQCNHDLTELKKRHRTISTELDNKAIIQINNVNPSWIVENSQAMPMNLGLHNEKKFKVGFVGNFNNEQKGNKIFLDAISDIKDPNIVFYIGGTGKNDELFRSMYGSNTNIFFCGWISNTCAFIKSCDLVVVPSLADSCPNTVMEAMYSGVPVIGSNRGGIPDILNQEQWVFNPDPKSISDKIITIFSENSNNKIRVEQAKRKEELEFDWAERIVETILKL